MMDELTYDNTQRFDMQIACYRNRTTLDTTAQWASRPKFHIAHDDHPDSHWSRYTQWQIIIPDDRIFQFSSSDNILEADQQVIASLKKQKSDYDVVTLSFIYENMLKTGTGLESLSPEYIAWQCRGWSGIGKDFKIVETDDDTPPPERKFLPENPMVEEFRQKLALLQSNFVKSHYVDELYGIQETVQNFFAPSVPDKTMKGLRQG